MEIKDLQVGVSKVYKHRVAVMHNLIVAVKEDRYPLYHAFTPMDLAKAQETVQKRMDELEKELQLLTQWKFLAGCVLKGWNPEPEDDKKDVHTEHCCLYHGCKYGDDANCSVVTGKRKQSFPCELCNEHASEDQRLVDG